MDALRNGSVAERIKDKTALEGTSFSNLRESVKVSSYALVTPARNESEFIELTIQSVIAQTVLPTKWVIVSDGSTDGTDEIVGRYAAEHPVDRVGSNAGASEKGTLRERCSPSKPVIRG